MRFRRYFCLSVVWDCVLRIFYMKPCLGLFDLGSVAVSSSTCMGPGVYGSVNGSLCGCGFRFPCVQVLLVFSLCVGGST